MKLLHELRDACVRSRIGRAGFFTGRKMRGIRRRRVLRDIQQYDQIHRIGKFCRDREDRQVDGGVAAVGFYTQAGAVYRITDDRGLPQTSRKFEPQSLAGHPENIACAGFPRGRFQIPPGTAMEVENVAAFIDEGGGGNDFLQERGFG